MPIVIRKRVSLDFLGEEYKEAYLIFKSIPAVDFDGVTQTLKTMEDKEQASMGFLIDLLKRYFLSGEFPDDEGKLQSVTADDIGQLDSASVIQCFQVFTGQDLDPKAETPLTNTSPTEA